MAKELGMSALYTVHEYYVICQVKNNDHAMITLENRQHSTSQFQFLSHNTHIC